ncbi:hypothetical protein K490DRAFT_66397 [Saccharata proteae CBS 121410]|uniref:Protein HRI1 n=1 Tax=Saccharata proteae CBS 121410 TaxID=1314787 RepID=A0A9P4HV51_9PEZI|nr:hypothetical protein K490DRAFT_66397 [Saccharata proteae CBS 121410]
MSSSSATTSTNEKPNVNQSPPADISERLWIRWADCPIAEPTSTFVLTAPSGAFVDIRLLKPLPHDPEDYPGLPNDPSAPLSRLDWAFSGVAQTTSADGDDVTHKRWLHIIDSKCGWGVKPPTDEGGLYDVAEDPNLSLERGVMVKPDTGEMTAYEELWRSLAVVAVGTDTHKTCIVASLDAPERKTRGVIIRLGQYCQGMMMVDDEVHLERWAFLPSNPLGKKFETPFGTLEDAGGWTRIARLGGVFLPCAWLFEKGRVAVGSELMYGNDQWVVREMVEW